VRGAPDAGGRHRARGEAGFPDRLAAPGARAVRTVVEPADGIVDLLDLLAGLGQQGGGVLPLERERRTFRVMLVVRAGLAGRFRDAGQLTL
jgi:hypothetical protein